MTALKILILIFSSLGYFRFISKQEGIGPYKAPFICCSLVSLALFIFAVLGHLQIGLITITAIGCALSAVELKHKSLSYIFYSLLPRSLSSYIIALPFAVYYLSIQSDFKFLLWDEFSFWLSSAKFIFETNALFNESSPIYVKSYPPIQQLFQYYFLNFASWSEKHVLYAQSFWVLSGLLCIAGSIIKSPLNVSLSFVISSAFLYFFGYSFSTIYSDPLLGVSFAACVALAWDQRNNRATSVSFFIAVGAFILLKEIAILLAAISVSVFTVSLWVGRQRSSSIKTVAQHLLLPLCLGVVSLFTVLKSWSWYVASIKATRDTVLPTVSEFLTGSLHNRLIATTTEFWLRLKKSGYVLFSDGSATAGPSILVLTAALIVLSVGLIAVKSDTSRLKRILTLLALAAGCLAYTAALFISYLVVFTEYEGVRLASFERYLSSYMLAWTILIYTFCIAWLSTKKTVAPLAIQLALACLVFYLSPKTYLAEIKSINASGPVFELRNDIEKFAEKVKAHMAPDEKVYFIAQNSNGLERVIFYYSMLPYQSSMSWCWSVGKKYFEGDVWTCDTKLAQLIKDYDYLAVYRGDEKLNESGEQMLLNTAFGKQPALFKIRKTIDKPMLLDQIK